MSLRCILLRIERWLRVKLRSSRTRKIEEYQQIYLCDFNEAQQFLRRLQDVDDQQQSLFEELRKRFRL